MKPLNLQTPPFCEESWYIQKQINSLGKIGTRLFNLTPKR